MSNKELVNKIIECSKSLFIAYEKTIENYMTLSTKKYKQGYMFYVDGQFFKTEEDIKKSDIFDSVVQVDYVKEDDL
ncbi:hypothetical protein AB837_00514 [bacterium AB1]|nr:hypothetical protein AB837_00514 [bacterium AB1]